MSPGTSSWTIDTLAAKLDLPHDEVRRRCFILGQHPTLQDRYPIAALALLRAQKERRAICSRCWRTGEPGPCQCRRGRREMLPEPEPPAGCSDPSCGIARPHFHRETPDGHEVVPI